MTSYRLLFTKAPFALALGLYLIFASPVFAQVGGIGGGTAGSPSGVGGETLGVTRLQGRVLCVGCSLEEARAAHPELGKQNLYLLTQDKQQVALQVDRVNNAEHWEDLTLSERIQVRGDDHLWETLTNDTSRNQELEIVGILRNTGTLDISGVSTATASLPATGNGVYQERR